VGLKMKKIRISRKLANALNLLFTIIFYALAFSADMRIGFAFLAYDISRVLESSWRKPE